MQAPRSQEAPKGEHWTEALNNQAFQSPDILFPTILPVLVTQARAKGVGQGSK